MSEYSRFTIAHIIRMLREINPLINSRNSKAFPKEKTRWLSHYRFRKEYVQINDDGSIRGGISHLICSTIDFSFIRSITAVAYSIFGGPCYDPVSLFLLDLFRYLEKFSSIKDFCLILRDPERGKNYRSLVGIRDDSIPCEATFSNFHSRIGESLYQEIFQALVSFVKELGLINFNILATDGTLFPSAARYHGCHCFQDSCASIAVDNIMKKIRERVLYRLEDQTRIVPGKQSFVKIECACTKLRNYTYIRDQGAIPLIGYNKRNEKLDLNALLERGYDQNGWPFVPYCHLSTRPNGFDPSTKRLSFSCFKQCANSKLPTSLELYRNCPHRARQLGYSTHVSIAQHPRLILEIPRGTERYRQIFALRSAAERTNSTLKEDFPILRKPPVRSLRRAAVVSQMGVITTLLDRVISFVIDLTVKERKFKLTGDKKWSEQLVRPKIPPHLQPFVAAS